MVGSHVIARPHADVDLVLPLGRGGNDSAEDSAVEDN
jgi:microcompartment protein CcmL/EutN